MYPLAQYPLAHGTTDRMLAERLIECGGIRIPSMQQRWAHPNTSGIAPQLNACRALLTNKVDQALAKLRRVLPPLALAGLQNINRRRQLLCFAHARPPGR